MNVTESKIVKWIEKEDDEKTRNKFLCCYSRQISLDNTSFDVILTLLDIRTKYTCKLY